MLDFLDKDFKTAVITILWQVRENILEMNEKEISLKSNKSYKMK